MVKIIEELIIVNGNQTKYKKPSWAVWQVIRANGLVEDICCHSIGHPNKEWLAEHDSDGKKGFGAHGCDGCCLTSKK